MVGKKVKLLPERPESRMGVGLSPVALLLIRFLGSIPEKAAKGGSSAWDLATPGSGFSLVQPQSFGPCEE